MLRIHVNTFRIQKGTQLHLDSTLDDLQHMHMHILILFDNFTSILNTISAFYLPEGLFPINCKSVNQTPSLQVGIINAHRNDIPGFDPTIFITGRVSDQIY